MWRRVDAVQRSAVFTVAVFGAAACGPSSSGYGDQLASYRRAQPPAATDDGRGLFGDADVLEVEPLLDAVLARNPNIARARAGWRGALARFPQATTFDDPTLSYSLAPLSIGSDAVHFGQTIELSQPLPYPGKRRLRGHVVLAEAEAAREDYEAVRLRVAQMAALLYYELYATDRALAINAEYRTELEQHRTTLTAHLAAGHAWQDDAHKIDVDLGEVRKARVDLEAERDVIVAQLNELLHRSPELPLPPPPSSLPMPEAPGASAEELRARAVRQRPEMRAAAARLDGAAARAAVADRDFYPDLRVMGRYSSMWATIEHEIMVGVAVTIPLWRGARHAAVEQADASRAGAVFASRATEDRIRTEVERAHRGYTAALAVAETYRDEILPSARARVQAIRGGLDSGRVAFIEVLRADHDLLSATLRYERALADAYRRRADLDAATGKLVGSGGGAA